MMIMEEARPVTLDDVDGQPLAVDLLKRFAANPVNAPKCLLFYGTYGTGKTSAARAFARAVNGIDKIDMYSNYITEHNCAVLQYEATKGRNTRSIESYLDDYLGYVVPDKWNVVIFDEIQGAESHTQTGMLKCLERRRDKMFFIFCTTDLNGVLPTVRSRCLPIEFMSISYDDVYKNLDKYGREHGYDIPDNIKSHIASRCNGHMRNAHNDLQKYIAVGGDTYIAHATSYYRLIAELFISAHKGDKNSLINYLKQLSFNSLFTVKQEFENFLIDCGNAKYIDKKSPITEVNMLLDEYGDDFTDIVDFYTGIWDNSLFASDRHFYMHILSFFKDMQSKRTLKTSMVGNR